MFERCRSLRAVVERSEWMTGWSRGVAAATGNGLLSLHKVWTCVVRRAGSNVRYVSIWLCTRCSSVACAEGYADLETACLSYGQVTLGEI